MVQNSPGAFMSYARFDDMHHGGFLSKFCKQLSHEVQAQSGHEFPIFQDRSDVRWGQNWQRRIEEGIDTTTFLIPILTPSFFQSEQCREEVIRFIEREQQLGHDDLILPLYYITVHRLSDSVRDTEDPVAMVLHDRLSKCQHADWRLLRNMPIERISVVNKICSLAADITIRLRECGYPSDIESTVSEQDVADAGAERTPKLSRAATRRRRERSSTANLHIVPSGKGSVAAWPELRDALIRTTFTPAEQSILSVRTRQIRAMLGQEYPTLPANAEEVSYAKEALEVAIDSALDKEATIADIKSACEAAEPLRRLLIGLLADTR